MDEDHKSLKDLAEELMMVKRKPTDILITVHIKNLDFAEVSRSFTLRFEDELEDIWNLLDANGKMHSVKYNQDLQNPTIVAGWTELRDYYQLTGNHQVSMTHFGDSFFLLTVYKSSSEPIAYPKWHSLYHQNPNSVTFKMLLNQYKATCSSLDVPSHMYYFLKDAKFTHINLRGTTKCRVIYNHHRKCAKIGAGWRLFANERNLNPGQEIIFEFPDLRSNFVLFWID